MDALIACILISICNLVLLLRLLPLVWPKFISRHLFGYDLSKPNKVQVPEAQGVVCGTVYLISLFIFIPIAFYQYLSTDYANFPHHRLVEFVAGLLSVCCMLLLGFADDVLDIRWRHKLLLPTIASLPLLTVYMVTYGTTTVVVPRPVRFLLGHDVNLGVLYYVYMGMLAVFCTNAINIYAGVNGLESGQSVLLAAAVALYNAIEIFNDRSLESNMFSLYMILPYLGVSLALLYYNWYPSRAFVGDTFCYFSGMTFAVVGILGHFSKTMLLFFAPQVINFLYSTPQLFHLIPCPRHRLPKYDAAMDRVGMSFTEFDPARLPLLGRLVFTVLRLLRLVLVRPKRGGGGIGACTGQEASALSAPSSQASDVSDQPDADEALVECNNLTLINFALYVFGPLHERTLTILLLSFQACKITCLSKTRV